MMQNFPAPGTGLGGQRNYVFVDEHNRHKRLKVMRACEGCRRRKIKCDSATTNTWPCAACTRLKLQCVPPPSGVEDQGDQGAFSDAEDFKDPAIFQQPGASMSPPGSVFQQEYQDPLQGHSFYPTSNYIPPQTYTGSAIPTSPVVGYPHMYRHASETSQASLPHQDSINQVGQHLDLSPTITQSRSTPDHSTAENLSDQFGDLKIAENGVAPYLRQEQKTAAEPEAPIQDVEIKLPSLNNGAGSQIRIPPELMPTDQEASYYFQLFFRDVHPYVPVINRTHFYNQWHSNRAAISPLLLEAVFACAGRMSDDPAQGAQWLALANKHEESFLDTPRLSTLQSLLLLLKARESSPKHGYYYRSWQTCKRTVSIAKDMDLHEHHELHSNGESCGSDSVECLTKTRVWQALLVCEMMVGAPQGRTDFGVDPSTVEISTSPPCSDLDDYEKAISRQYAYFVRNARNIRLCRDSAEKLKKKKDWGLDPEFVAYNVAFKNWPSELPKDLQLLLPQDESPPALASHFIGNMHSHYQLGIVMLHRPQLVASKSFATDHAWKQQMSLCYDSSKLLCRIQEAILTKFGINGLLCMLRGINFTIYAILTCTMVHLIAVTSPDPEFNKDAREYFSRHMRILEQCMSAWPMPETEAQVNALRAAFTADMNKPFMLKESFPYGSPTPSEQYRPSPPLESQSHSQSQPPVLASTFQGQVMRQHAMQASYMTPPISVGGHESKLDSPLDNQPYVHDGSYTQMPPTMYQQQPIMHDSSQWNPTPIIVQFNTAFSIPQSQMAPSRSQSFTSSAPMPLQPHLAQMHHSQLETDPYPQQYLQQFHQSTSITSTPQPQVPPQQQPINYAPEERVFVTPKDWQQSVASVFDPGGLKRRWDFQAHVEDRTQKRMR